jgi:hypothetical protein
VLLLRGALKFLLIVSFRLVFDWQKVFIFHLYPFFEPPFLSSLTWHALLLKKFLWTLLKENGLELEVL